jgi:hypothetical protein
LALNKTQIGVLAMSMVSVAAIGAGLDDWNAVLKPSFIFPALGAIGSTLAAVYTEKPGQDAITERKAANRANVAVLVDRQRRRVGKDVGV